MHHVDSLWTLTARYGRPRHPISLALAFVGILILQIAAAGRQASLPSALGSPIVPYQGVLPVVLACLVVTGLSSSCQELEESAGGALRRAENIQLAGSTLMTAAALAATAETGSAAVLARSFLIWTGLALLAGRILEPTLAWVLPIGTLFPLIYFGWDAMNRPRWWNWLDQPVTHLSSWALAVGALALGMAARYATPWRLHALRGRSRG